MATTMVAHGIPTLNAGETYGVPYSDFYDKSGNSIDTRLTFSQYYFEISKKKISKGADLVKEITISDLHHEVAIVINDSGLPPLPSSPNVVIERLEVQAKKTVRKDGETFIRAGDDFSYQGSIRLRVGITDSSHGDLDVDNLDLTLHPSDKKTIQWNESTGSGDVTIRYGDVATGYGRVYGGETITYGYENDMPRAIIRKNPNAKMTSIKIISEGQAAHLNIELDANVDDFVYINKNGVLTQDDGPTWNEDSYQWEDKIKTTTHYIVSDRKLYSNPYGEDADKSKNEENKDDPPTKNFNPNTGRGETGVAISGIFAIMMITCVSVVMVTLRRIISKGKSSNEND